VSLCPARVSWSEIPPLIHSLFHYVITLLTAGQSYMYDRLYWLY